MLRNFDVKLFLQTFQGYKNAAITIVCANIIGQDLMEIEGWKRGNNRGGVGCWNILSDFCDELFVAEWTSGNIL